MGGGWGDMFFYCETRKLQLAVQKSVDSHLRFTPVGDVASPVKIRLRLGALEGSHLHN